MTHLVSHDELLQCCARDCDVTDLVHQRVAKLIFQSGYEGHVDLLKSLPIGYQTEWSACCAVSEINNGGFYQYFGNSSAEDYHDLAVIGFRTIGATQVAELFEEVFNELLRQSEFFRTTYRTQGMQSAFNHANDSLQEIEIEEFDERFFAINEATPTFDLLRNYICTHPQDF